MQHTPLNVLVTGGGTVAPIDDVRVIANVSTGRFSSQISEAFLERGAHVWHLCTTSAERPIERLARFDFAAPTVENEFDRLKDLHERWRNVRDRLTVRLLEHSTVSDYAAALQDLLQSVAFDVVVLAMAVSDYEPQAQSGKIASSTDELIIHCRRTPKVINSVRDQAPSAILVGFKLLSGATRDELLAAARRTLHEARADLVVANDLRFVHTDRHAIFLVHSDGSAQSIGPQPNLAGGLVDRLMQCAAYRESPRRA